ncbi:MAG: site-specific DNA-methyltransferase [Alphaproteobacteria bacterium]|nr:site-specific DNA-methyltransferase [Alphaproteobacteria bacterium]
MRTLHRALRGDARDLSALPDGSVQLVVTSPPYPMIAMWDAAFAAMAPDSAAALAQDDGAAAFAAMHAALDDVWAACHRVLCDGGLLCLNIGDATRTIGGRFALWPNHARILQGAMAAGFSVLPDLLWHKPTNSPTKFMGSGMLPGGAYVTYEHEYVLILRKGDKRAFSRADAERRRRSAFFWEERNDWFSDLWRGLPGVGQQLEGAGRERSAAFPFALPWRLIHMYSLQGDVVLDPFVGTGTTMAAALVAGRSSVGVDLDPDLVDRIGPRLAAATAAGPDLVSRRLSDHRAFVAGRLAAGKALQHHNAPHDVAVVTGQERALQLFVPVALEPDGADTWRAHHAPLFL